MYSHEFLVRTFYDKLLFRLFFNYLFDIVVTYVGIPTCILYVQCTYLYFALALLYPCELCD